MAKEKITKDELGAGLTTLSQEIKLVHDKINTKLSETEIDELTKRLKKLSRLVTKLKKATSKAVD